MYRRISETELMIPTLQFLYRQPNGFATTSELINHLTNALNPGGPDMEILDGRNDTYFSQKVRNMISHRDTRGNIVYDGYAVYCRARRGLRITDAGRHYINQQN